MTHRTSLTLALAFAVAAAIAPAAAQDRIPANERPADCPVGGPLQVWLLLQSSATDCDASVSGTVDALCCCVNNTWAACASSSGGSGTVTSVGLAVPAEWSVSGSPVTTSGTITISEATQTANTVYAGPTSGGAAAPGFRALVAADVPRAASWDNAPASPHAYDDEFSVSTLDAKWTPASTVGSLTSGSVDYTASLTDPIYDLGISPGWLMLQSGSTSVAEASITQTITFATDATVFVKFGWLQRDVSATAEGNIYVKFYDSADTNEWAYMGISRGSINSALFGGVNNNGATTRVLSFNVENLDPTGPAYVVMWKKSNVYHFGSSMGGGVFSYLGSVTKTGVTTLDRMQIVYYNANETPSIVDGVDFVRYEAALNYSLMNP